MRSVVEMLQPIGRALMLPIAVLPVAGLLLRLGQSDLLDIGLLAAAGDALFANLGLLFAIGVACGIARDGNGAACLAGVVCYLVVRNGGPVFLTVPAEVTRGFDEGVAATLSAAWKAKAFARLDTDHDGTLDVTELMGMAVNGVTGDYSRGAAGFMIRDGALAEPVSEVTIAGNVREMLLHMTPADDLEFRRGTDSPTVRVEGLTMAGG